MFTVASRQMSGRRPSIVSVVFATMGSNHMKDKGTRCVARLSSSMTIPFLEQPISSGCAQNTYLRRQPRQQDLPILEPFGRRHFLTSSMTTTSRIVDSSQSIRRLSSSPSSSYFESYDDWYSHEKVTSQQTRWMGVWDNEDQPPPIMEDDVDDRLVELRRSFVLDELEREQTMRMIELENSDLLHRDDYLHDHRDSMDDDDVSFEFEMPSKEIVGSTEWNCDDIMEDNDTGLD